MIRIYAQHTQNDDLHSNRDFMTSENTVASPACSRPTLQIMRVSHYSVLVRDYTLDRVLADDSVDPSDVGRCSSVDCRSPLGRTTSERAPTHYSVQEPASVVVAGQWTARVTLQQRNTQHTVQTSGQRISTKGRTAAPPPKCPFSLGFGPITTLHVHGSTRVYAANRHLDRFIRFSL